MLGLHLGARQEIQVGLVVRIHLQPVLPPGLVLGLHLGARQEIQVGLVNRGADAGRGACPPDGGGRPRRLQLVLQLRQEDVQVGLPPDRPLDRPPDRLPPRLPARPPACPRRLQLVLPLRQVGQLQGCKIVKDCLGGTWSLQLCLQFLLC